jgi:hypothetical protein
MRQAYAKLAILIRAHRVKETVLSYQVRMIEAACYFLYNNAKAAGLWASYEFTPAFVPLLGALKPELSMIIR